MSRPVVPIRSLATRLTDAGRIRIGVKVKTKNGKERPEKLNRFRFTSSDRPAIEQIAEIYGGDVKPWHEPKAAKGQYEVITEATEIRIALPPDPLGGTPIYELWSGGGCQRRCDGEQCEMQVQGQDGTELQQVPCHCATKGELECQVKIRLSVLLPEIRFVGVWRLDSSSWNAAQEMPGMVDVIRSLQDKGIVRGLLRVEWRRQVLAGQTREFAVPALGVDESLNELAAGHARMGALSTAGPVAALGAGEDAKQGAGADGSEGQASPSGGPATAASTTGVPEPEPAPTDPDDDIVDAEIVSDGDRDELERLATTGRARVKALRAAFEAAKRLGLPLPESFEDITNPRLIAAAVAALDGAS